MDILGIRIDNLTREELFEKIEFFLSQKKFYQIATVGPEFIMEAQKDVEYKNILNNCDLNIADGFGITLAFWRYGKKLKARITGADLIQKILRIAEGREVPIFLACRNDGLSTFEETKKAILKKYPKLKIFGDNIDHTLCHSERSSSGVEESNEVYNLIRSLGLARDDKNNIKKFNIVFANFGSPYQEIFINSLKNDMMGIGLGVGGSFDFITGKIKRAPVLMQRMGLEWLWRLIIQPWEQKWKRLKRIWNAVVIFPIKIIISAKGSPH